MPIREPEHRAIEAKRVCSMQSKVNVGAMLRSPVSERGTIIVLAVAFGRQPAT